MKSLTQEDIDRLFEEEEAKPNPQQVNVFISLYKKAFPNLDEIKTLKNWPRVSRTTQEYLFTKFINFDKKHHPKVLNGGLWLNKGFSIKDDLQDWQIDISQVETN